MARAAQVKEGQFDIGVVDRALEHLAIRLGKGGPNRLGLAHHSADRPLQGITLYEALDFHE
jgi:hypothetical protein